MKEDLESYFKPLKLKNMSTFKDRMFRRSLVKELYSTIAIDRIELEDQEGFTEDTLNVFLNGRHLQTCAQDLGEFLKT
ncbi:Uncharacterized protein TCM_003758 [Theobroma cacao]|uniref:Uncharacterized protein n=1 Tax=Theobroma cacao TaxID=3641 RepID=A0A061DN67_THECC|nr:Uncharacterized protein TCM_003758 [Theobroma cacao]